MISEKNSSLIRLISTYPLLTFLILLSAYSCINRLLLSFHYTFNLGGLENYFIYHINKVNGLFIYKNPEEYPYEVNQYTPLYFYFSKAIILLFKGLELNEIRVLYVSGRIMNIIFNILSSIFIYKFFIQILEAKKNQALTISLIIFNLFIVHNYAVRPDSLKVLFLIASAYFTGKYIKSQNIGYLVCSAILSFLAILTKQDALIYVFMLSYIIFYFVGFKKSFQFLLFTGSLTISGLIIIGYKDLSALIKNLIVGIDQGASLSWFKLLFETNILQFTGIFLLLALILSSKSKNKLFEIIGILFLIISVSSSALKWGSDMNYFTEIQIVLFSVTFYYISLRKNLLTKIVFTLSFLFVIIGNQYRQKTTTFNYWSFKEGKKEYFENKKKAEYIRQFTIDKNINNIILIDLNLSIELSDIAILGTIVNEYPEYYFEGIDDLVGDVPNKTYEYQFNCEENRNISLISTISNNEKHQKYIEAIFDKPFNFKRVSTNSDIIIEEISCL